MEDVPLQMRLSDLLRSENKTEAKSLILSSTDEDLIEMSRVAKIRTIALFEGKEEISQVATEPVYMALTTEEMNSKLVALVSDARRASGVPELEPEPEPEKELESGEPEGEEKMARPKKAKTSLPMIPGKRGPGRPKGSKNKPPEEKAATTPAPRRGLRPGKPPEDAGEAPQPQAEPAAPPETPPADDAAVKELLKRVEETVDSKLQEVLINVSALTKSIGQLGGQEKQTRESVEKLEEFTKHFQVLYEQNAFIIEALGLVGAATMDQGTEEFKEAVLKMLEHRTEERRKRMPNATKKEEAAASGDKSDD